MSNYTVRIVLGDGKAVEFYGPADITQETTDAIVNAANSSLMGGGGVDGAIHRAGGPAILAECKTVVSRIGHLPAGQAVITTAGHLRARHVIHTVGPIYRGGKGEAETLAGCYRLSIRLADEHKLTSLSFPSISTGAFGYPVIEAAQVAVTAAYDSLLGAKSVRRVRFVLFDAGTLSAYVKAGEKLASGSGYSLEKGTP